MDILNKTIGAMFLSQSQFRSKFSVPNDMAQHVSGINYKRLAEARLFQSLAEELRNSFSKEVKIEQDYMGDTHLLELYVFPPAALKLAVEYIISEMPQSEINRIRTSKLYESQQLNTSGITSKSDLKRPAPPPPPMDRRWKEGEEPPKPKQSL
jgi:hypothetical protein